MSRAVFRYFGIKLNCEDDKDIIEYLESRDNIQGAIKYVLRWWIQHMFERGINDEEDPDKTV